MESVIAAVIVIVIIAMAVRYIYKTKKSGAKCIGCPDSGACSVKSCSSCGCGGQSDENK